MNMLQQIDVDQGKHVGQQLCKRQSLQHQSQRDYKTPFIRNTSPRLQGTGLLEISDDVPRSLTNQRHVQLKMCSIHNDDYKCCNHPPPPGNPKPVICRLNQYPYVIHAWRDAKLWPA